MWPGVRRAGLPRQSPAQRRAAAECNGAALIPMRLNSATQSHYLVTRCLEVCFTQRVKQPMPRSEAVRDVRESPLMTAVSRPFWHGHGTNANARRSDRRLPTPYLASPRIHRSFPTSTSLPTSPGGCGAPHRAFFRRRSGDRWSSWHLARAWPNPGPDHSDRLVLHKSIVENR